MPRDYRKVLKFEEGGMVPYTSRRDYKKSAEGEDDETSRVEKFLNMVAAGLTKKESLYPGKQRGPVAGTGVRG